MAHVAFYPATVTPLVVPLARTRLALLALALLAMTAASVATLLVEQHRWLAILTGMSYLSLLLQLAKLLFDRRPLLVADDSGILDRTWRHPIPWADIERIEVRRILGLSLLSVVARDAAAHERILGVSALALVPALALLRLSPLVTVLSLGREAPRAVAATLEAEHATRLAGAHAYR